MGIKSKLLAAATAFVLSTNAGAALRDNGTTTIDTDTGLEWLDITETMGLAYSSVLVSDFVTVDGYRYATEAEVFQLFTNAGGTPSTELLYENWAPALLLMDLMGCTRIAFDTLPSCELSNPDSANWSKAMWGDGEYIALIQEVGDPSIGDPSTPIERRVGGWLLSRWATTFDLVSNHDIGSFLVRTAVDIDSDGDGLSDVDELALGTDPGVADTDGDTILDGSDPDIIATAITALPLGVFSNRGDPRGHRNAMLSRLIDIQSDIASGDIEQALRALRNLRTRVDGCDTPTGTSPERNDWITDCVAQLEIRRLIDLLITNLES